MIVFVALIMLSGAAAAGDFKKYFDRCVWAELSLCAAATGVEQGTININGHPTLGIAIVRIDQVAQVIPLGSTEKCSMIGLKGGDTGTIVGSPGSILGLLDPEGCE